MNFLYRSKRIGRFGKPFVLYKVRTLKLNSDENQFANPEKYVKFGRFLRKTKLDELPQLWNLIKRDMNIVGPRPEEERTIELLPKDIKDILLSRRPGLTSLASIHYFDETSILEKSKDPHRDYWTKIKPNKILLDIFYIKNRDLLLDIWIVLKTALLIIKNFFKNA